MRRLSHALALLVALAVAGTVALLALIGIQYARNDRPIVLPSPRGQHPVGRAFVQWTDRRRARDLMVFVWYPATRTGGGKRAAYIPGRWGTLAAKGYIVIPAHRMEGISVAAEEGVPPAAGTHPVLVLLPALGRAPAHYTTLAEDLASHGYLVVGVAPTGSTKNVVFPDGRLVQGETDPDLTNEQVGEDLVQEWLGDAEFAAAHVFEAVPFGAVADRQRIAVVGHALGGAIAMRLLARDNDFRAGVNLEGSPLKDVPRAPDRPLLILVGGNQPPLLAFADPRHDDRLAAICAADRAGCTFRRFEQAGQADFTDEAVLPSRFPMPSRLIGLGVADGARFQREIADALLRFFARL